ncbi:MAG: calcium:proton antiporter [Gemmobacter sp.]
MATDRHIFVPLWTWAAPLLVAGLLALKAAHVLDSGSVVLMVAATALIGACVFAAVHHADQLAARVGEPFGSILLALAITVMEVAVILSVMAAGTGGADAVARDTVFAAVMIVLNGIVGLCLVVGGLRHHEQSFRADGAAAILSVIAVMAVISLVLPNFTVARAGPSFSPFQQAAVGLVSLILYAVFLFVQTARHPQYFLHDDTPGHAHPVPDTGQTMACSVLLLVNLAAVILLAKALTPTVEKAVLGAGLPVAFVGVVIALLILMPEGLTSLRLAIANRLQSSLNAALGSALATIGLTIPCVAVAALVLDRPLVLGLSGEGMVLLVLTLFTSSLTLATGRTTILQGAVHLVIFAIFLVLSAVP